ncbi:MAG: glutamine synthetase family protein [Bdellovibrionota bacterium]
MVTEVGASYEKILAEIDDSGAKKIKVAIADLDGILRGKFIHIKKFKSALKNGFGFCNVVFGWDSSDVCYDNVSYTGWHTGYPDADVRLDLSSCRRIPWDEENWFFLGDFVQADGSPLAVCPRQLLKRVLKISDTMGYKPRVGCEFEWFNFDETPASLAQKDFSTVTPLTPGMYGYSLLRSGMRRDFFNDLIDMMEDYEIPLEGLHTETGPGVYEAAICNSDALEAADRAILFKAGVKEIAHLHGIVASFMARWNASLPGCSGHIHQSIEDGQGKNLFFDSGDKYNMSATFRSYLAGQIKFLPELTLMLAPTVNSYKRLVEGYWAPTRANWSIDNRTCALRVIATKESATRVEVRVPGADMNPYLGVAATLAAGLSGVKNHLTLGQEMVTGSGYKDEKSQKLPTNMLDAIKMFRESELAKEWFGETFVQHYAASREWEWQQSQKVVTDWELKRYFEII